VSFSRAGCSARAREAATEHQAAGGSRGRSGAHCRGGSSHWACWTCGVGGVCFLPQGQVTRGGACPFPRTAPRLLDGVAKSRGRRRRVVVRIDAGTPASWSPTAGMMSAASVSRSSSHSLLLILKSETGGVTALQHFGYWWIAASPRWRRPAASFISGRIWKMLCTAAAQAW
jgi:hypothetical protein